MARFAALLVVAVGLSACSASPTSMKVTQAKATPLASPLAPAPVNPLPVVNPGNLLSNDGGGLLSNDGGGLLSNDGGGLLAKSPGGAVLPEVEPPSLGAKGVEDEAPATTPASVHQATKPGSSRL